MNHTYDENGLLDGWTKEQYYKEYKETELIQHAFDSRNTQLYKTLVDILNLGGCCHTHNASIALHLASVAWCRLVQSITCDDDGSKSPEARRMLRVMCMQFSDMVLTDYDNVIQATLAEAGIDTIPPAQGRA